jgi:glucan phosphoethanolaminetransferase (alkaline phosphatase superfamily)
VLRLVPIHVEFAIKRVNDLFMLTFGECVIQIVTTISTLQDVQFAVTFGASYCQIALVALIFYCVVPETIDESVARRNALRAMVNFLFMPFGVASILAFATGLSLEFQDRPEGTTLLCYSLAATLFYLNFVKVIHVGFKEEFLITSKGKRSIKLLLWLGKFGTIAGVAAVSTDATLSKNKAAMSVVLASLIGACHIFCLVDLWIFHEEFLKIVEAEVTKRRKLLLEQQQQEQQQIIQERESNLQNITQQNNNNNSSNDQKSGEIVVGKNNNGSTGQLNKS